MNILFVTFGLPLPPDSGARIRDFNLISRMAEHHEVSVLSLLEFPDELEHAEPLKAVCKLVDGVVAKRSGLRSATVAITGLLAGRPVATTHYFYPELARRIRELTDSHHFDLVQIEHSFLAPYRDALAPGFRGATVLSFHNIGVDQYRSMYDMSRGTGRLLAGLKWFLMRRWEVKYARRFDRAIVVSERDAERLQELDPGSTATVVANGVDSEKLQVLARAQTDQPGLIFVGTMGYLPNREGVRHFCNEIFPLIHNAYPDCRLTAVGSGGREHLSDLAQDGLIEITGRVTDLAPYYARAQVAIVPLRSGGGSRLKILESMALGRPVVTTTLGREGLDLQDGKEILTGDEAHVFARHVVALLGDDQRWSEQVAAARRRIELSYDWSLAADRLLGVYRELGGREPGLKHAPDYQGGRPAVPNPRLSVIIPVFNMGKDLARSLDCLKKSTFQEFELIIVDDHSTDNSAEIARSRCDQFIQQDRNRGQAAARNLGAGFAKAKWLFFLDADVLAGPETLAMIMSEIESGSGISALFCSYQHDTIPKNFVSQYKNLQHHYTHQISSREAITFCGGFGAIRKDVFDLVGGFDESQRAMEDVDLGYRLHLAGHRIRLCPRIQLTHIKKYSLPGLIKGEVFQRAIPWTRVMLTQRVVRNDLNTKTNNIVSVCIVFMMCVAPLIPALSASSLPVIECVLLLALLLLNRHFLVFLGRMRGFGFALRAVPMIWLQYFYSGFGLVLGMLSFGWERLLSFRGTAKHRHT